MLKRWKEFADVVVTDMLTTAFFAYMGRMSTGAAVEVPGAHVETREVTYWEEMWGRERAELANANAALVNANLELAAYREADEVLRRRAAALRDAIGARPGETLEEAATRVRADLAALEAAQGRDDEELGMLRSAHAATTERLHELAARVRAQENELEELRQFRTEVLDGRKEQLRRSAAALHLRTTATATSKAHQDAEEADAATQTGWTITGTTTSASPGLMDDARGDSARSLMAPAHTKPERRAPVVETDKDIDALVEAMLERAREKKLDYNTRWALGRLPTLLRAERGLAREDDGTVSVRALAARAGLSPSAVRICANATAKHGFTRVTWRRGANGGGVAIELVTHSVGGAA